MNVTEKIGAMGDLIKAAFIVGIAIIGSTALWIYYSPYQSCVRAYEAQFAAQVAANAAPKKARKQNSARHTKTNSARRQKKSMERCFKV